MEILKKTGKFLLGVVIGVAIMMFADRYGEHQPSVGADLSDRPSA